MATGAGRAVRVDWMKLFTQVATTKTYTTPFAALCTSNPGDDGQFGSTPNPGTTEPSTTGGYARQAITWNTISTPSNDAAAQATNSAAINFGNGSPASGGSTAAYSTTSNALTHVGIYNTATLSTTTEAAFLARTAVAGGGFAVNAAGITYTLPANTGIVLGAISA